MGVEVGLLQPFWLALLPLPLLWLRWQRHRRGMSSVVSPSLAMRYPLLPVIHTDSGVPRVPGSATVEVMISMALLLVVIALAQPVRYTGSVATTADSEPVDLVVVAGTAISMTLRDYIVGGEPVACRSPVACWMVSSPVTVAGVSVLSCSAIRRRCGCR